MWERQFNRLRLLKFLRVRTSDIISKRHYIYFMNNFSNEVESRSDNDLLKMVYEFDVWCPEMLEAIQTELIKRDKLPSDVNEQKQKLIEIEEIQLVDGKQASLVGEIVGWLTVFGLLGIYIGYNYSFSKVKSNYTNKEYYRYSEDSRKRGSYLFYTSIVLSILGIIYKILPGL